jgi:hypothetical protein
MDVEDRIAALEKRVREAEDTLAIMRLITTYGPLVDSRSGQAAARAWIEGGIYDVLGIRKFVAYDELANMYENDPHLTMTTKGCAHIVSTPNVFLDGDTAEAVAYVSVMLKEDDRWYPFRVSINTYELVRTDGQWRIKIRYNHPVDGSKTSHDMMKKAIR